MIERPPYAPPDPEKAMADNKAEVEALINSTINTPAFVIPVPNNNY